jgi:hypothetical protein
MTDKVPCGIKFQDRRSRQTARADGRIQGCGFQIVIDGRFTMNDPHVILGVHRNTDDGPENPVIRQRLRPERIHFEHRRLNTSALSVCTVLKHGLSRSQSGQQNHDGASCIKVTFPLRVAHRSLQKGSMGTVPIYFP